MGTVLEVKPPCADLLLGDKFLCLSRCEGDEFFFLLLIGIFSADLDGIPDQLFQHITFVVQTAPDQICPIMVNEFSQLLATLLNCATAFLTLFLETDRGKCEQHSFRKRFCFDHMLMFIQWRVTATIVIESPINGTPQRSRAG